VVAGRQNRKQTSARRAAQARARQEERRRLRRWIIAFVVLAAVVAAFVLAQGGGGSKSTSKSTKTATAPHTDVATATVGGPPGPEGIPLQEGEVLAPGATPAGGATVDGIQCQASEQVAYHLSVYVDGVLRPLPAGIGIVQPVAHQTQNGPFYGATTCYYWLHVHAQDGVIHVESPSVRTYTLGQFFALWGQPLSATGVGSATGPLTVFVDGHPHQGDPAAIALGAHEDIQIDVGNPVVPPQKVTWANGL
jgi:hypothetical protein